MIVEKEVEVSISSKNRKHYADLGYEIPMSKDDHYRMRIKKGTKIKVKVDDLMINSHERIHYKCDNCGKDGTTTYQYYKQTEHEGKKYCAKCAANIVTKQVFVERYGVNNPMHNPEIAAQIKEINKTRYGAENPFASEVIKEKIRKTNLDNLGVEYPMQSELVKEKSKQTCLDKYGVEFSLQSREVREKGMISLAKENKVPTSKQQIAICHILKNRYGDENVELNYPLSGIALDIRLIYGDILFDIEYDCFYWHKDKQQRDRRRDEFTKSQGYKVLRIKSGHIIPTIEEIEKQLSLMVENDYQYSEIVLDDWLADELE